MTRHQSMNPERDTEIVKALAAPGATYASVGLAYGLSGERVRKIKRAAERRQRLIEVEGEEGAS